MWISSTAASLGYITIFFSMWDISLLSQNSALKKPQNQIHCCWYECSALMFAPQSESNEGKFESKSYGSEQRKQEDEEKTAEQHICTRCSESESRNIGSNRERECEEEQGIKAPMRLPLSLSKMDWGEVEKLWPWDGLATPPGWTLPLAHWQLG